MENVGRILMVSLLKSFNISGRDQRSDFWIFFAFWMPITVFLLWVFSPPTNESFFGAKIYLICVVLLSPLLSAAARRLQDTGESGNAAFLPIVPFGILYAVFIGIPLLFLGSAQTFFQVGNSTGDMIAVFSAGVGTLLGLLAYLSYYLFFVIALITTLILTSSILGQTLLPSQPDPNPYGPNPNEVPI